MKIDLKTIEMRLTLIVNGNDYLEILQ